MCIIFKFLQYNITSRAAAKPHTRRFSFLNSGLMYDTVCMCVALASFPLRLRFLSSARLFKSSPHAFSTNCTSNEQAVVNYRLSITTVPGSCILFITLKKILGFWTTQKRSHNSLLVMMCYYVLTSSPKKMPISKHKTLQKSTSVTFKYCKMTSQFRLRSPLPKFSDIFYSNNTTITTILILRTKFMGRHLTNVEPCQAAANPKISQCAQWVFW